MIQAYLNAFRNYADFKGRARRRDYWLFVVANMIVGFVVGFVAGNIPYVGGLISTAYSLAILIPSLAICVRRLHDIGKSGWSLLFMLIPIVGSILVLVWLCKDSSPDANEWGISPKYGCEEPVVFEAAPVEAAPVEEAPVEVAPVEEAPAEETPAAEAE